MILVPYRIAPSRIDGAGKGLFLEQAVEAGQTIIAPDAIPKTWAWRDLEALPDFEALAPSAVRWFEDQFTVTPEWPDECYVNHAFRPNGIWHLGFIFASADLEPGCEITIDYRHLLGTNQTEAFRDAETGQAIIGLPWAESLRITTEQLLRAIKKPGA